MVEVPFQPGIEYWRYIQTQTYNRLVEGYASDEFWNVLSRTSDINKAIEISKVLPELADRIPDIADLLEKKPFMDWYVEVADYVSVLVDRTDTLKSVADQLTGVVVERFFDLVGDLVGVHDNLMWYGDTRTVSAAYDLFGERTRIIEATAALHGIRDKLVELNADLYDIRDSLKRISANESALTTLVGDKTNLHWLAGADVKSVLESFVTGGVLPTIKENAFFNKSMNISGTLSLVKPLELATADPLKPLADISSKLVGLNTDLYGIRDPLKDLAGNRDILDWYSSADISDIIGGLVSKGILPEIKEPTKFLKDMDILGKLNLLERVKSHIDARFNALDFTVSYDFTDKIFYPGPFDAPTHFWFNNRFVGLTGLRDWADWIKNYMTEFANVTIDKHRDKIVDAMLIFSQGVRSVLDCFIDISQNIKSWVG